MDIRLNNRLIFINGITGAIGERVARGCISVGGEVYGIYGKDKLRADALSREGVIRSLSIDFTREKFTPSLLKNLVGDKKVYGIVNASGVTVDKPLVRMSPEDWDEVVNVNLDSIFYLTRAIVPLMREGGRIINISSSVGLIGRDGQASYAAAKAGLWAFTKSIAREVARYKIMVNLVLPGFIPSKMTQHTSVREEAKKESLTGELMSSGVVADFIIYLLSDCSQGITGQAFNIDNRIRRWW